MLITFNSLLCDQDYRVGNDLMMSLIILIVEICLNYVGK